MKELRTKLSASSPTLNTRSNKALYFSNRALMDASDMVRLRFESQTGTHLTFSLYNRSISQGASLRPSSSVYGGFSNAEGSYADRLRDLNIFNITSAPTHSR